MTMPDGVRPDSDEGRVHPCEEVLLKSTGITCGVAIYYAGVTPFETDGSVHVHRVITREEFLAAEKLRTTPC